VVEHLKVMAALTVEHAYASLTVEHLKVLMVEHLKVLNSRAPAGPGVFVKRKDGEGGHAPIVLFD